jgi:hypothetical protein
MNNSYRFLPSQLLAVGISLATMAGVTSVSAVEAGRVLFAIGDVRIIAPDGSSRAAKRNDIVQNGERMQTAKGALGQVRMINGERVGVRGGSKVRFSDASAIDAYSSARRQHVARKPAPASRTQPRQLELESGRVRVLNVAAPGKAEMQPVYIKIGKRFFDQKGADATFEGSVDKVRAGVKMRGTEAVIRTETRRQTAYMPGDMLGDASRAPMLEREEVKAEINHGKVFELVGAIARIRSSITSATYDVDEVVSEQLSREPSYAVKAQERAAQKIASVLTNKGSSFAKTSREAVGEAASLFKSLQNRARGTQGEGRDQSRLSRVPAVQAAIVLAKERPTFTLTRPTGANKITVSRLSLLQTRESAFRTQTLAIRVPSRNPSRLPAVQAAIVLAKERPTFTLTRPAEANKITVDTLSSRAGALTLGKRVQRGGLKMRHQAPTLRSLGIVNADTRL